ncbi:MAG: tRNA (guanosine(46)-N7)-methyltransferase TrmB [Spirulinaceae cyanobacterium SM2_1_0]|nr:tRNA (guanosine(46)-N7)-methyltransferase TrmB [Spirulinaceae cyanobacterium SM2_1_0]
MPRVRVRQHVNPLSSKYQQPVACPDWTRVYAEPSRPLHLDIGCARGTFLLELAPLRPTVNFLGLEIREPLVAEANARGGALGLTNLHYHFCNVNIDLPHLFTSLPAPVLHWVTIQFPDPWFKQRHLKRRVVQPELVAAIADALPQGGQVFLQSDVLSVAQEMRSRFAAHPAFQATHPDPWLAVNPLPVPTEREVATLAKGEPVYRCQFTRTQGLDSNSA